MEHLDGLAPSSMNSGVLGSWIHIPALLLITCQHLHKIFHFSEPQFPYVEDGFNAYNHSTGLLDTQMRKHFVDVKYSLCNF